MNSIRCPKCGFENAFGLVFCTNCGESLYHSGARPTNNPTQPSNTNANTVALQTKSGTNTKLLIFGGLGCFGLMFGAVILLGILYFIGSRRDVNAVNNNSNSANVLVANSNTSNQKTINSNKEIDDTDLSAFEFAPTIGPYEMQGQSVGSPADDFPGADEVTKATYVKKDKSVEFVIAKFSSRETAKSGYENFLKQIKDSGAKVQFRRKVKTRAGVVNGEISLYTYDKKWHALFYSEKQGGHYYAPDRFTMKEFSEEFSKVYGSKD